MDHHAPQPARDISQESEYSLLLSSLDVSVSKHLLDEHFTVVWANSRYYEMFGYTEEEYETLFYNRCDLFYRSAPEDWNELVRRVTDTYGKGKSKYELICRMPHRDGRKLWIKLVGTLSGEVIEGKKVSYTVMMDITEQMQTKLEQTVTYNNFPGPISKFRAAPHAMIFMEANPRYFEVFPRKERYLVEEMTPESGLFPIASHYGEMRRGIPLCFTIFQDDIRAKRVYMNVCAECVDRIGEDPVYLLTHTDITEVTEKNARLEYLAFTDPVTGGMNGTRFDMVAREAVASHPPASFALAWLNIRKFKLINDIAGEQQGNRTLRHVHNVLNRMLNPGELVCRAAADNFALLVWNAPDAQLEDRLSGMVAEVNRFNESLARKYYLSFNAGIYRIDDPKLEITQIQDRARVAVAGNRGVSAGSLCSCHFYSDAERMALIAETNIENRMFTALTGGEFAVYLQPKLCLQSQTTAGAEALVRWQDPQRGLVTPDRFIPIFEKNGFIVRLDLYVLEQVCAALRRWMDRGLEVMPISVNVSRAHFSSHDFLQQYAQVCARYGVPTRLIELEVTETVMYDASDRFIDIVNEMHELGFSCSMDDFGSGYSSLNLLKNIAMDTLKLDRAFFLSKTMEDARERDVVQTVIELAQKLNMATVAEGVETEAQKRFLADTQCTMIQGYLYARPLPLHDYEAFVYGKSLQ